MESNLHQMASFFADKPVKLRPHFKNHKSLSLARRQLGNGAIGLTCATLREAEVLVRNGFHNVLVANEIAGNAKINQFADLSGEADVIVAVDDARVVGCMAAVSRARAIPL